MEDGCALWLFKRKNFLLAYIFNADITFFYDLNPTPLTGSSFKLTSPVNLMRWLFAYLLQEVLLIKNTTN